MPVTVVHVRKTKYNHYIGRDFSEFRGSIYGNPFPLYGRATRKEVLLSFAKYWYAPEQAWLRKVAVVELTGKVLGCWCKPKDCHGDIIAGYVNWKNSQPQGTLFQ